MSSDLSLMSGDQLPGLFKLRERIVLSITHVCMVWGWPALAQVPNTNQSCTEMLLFVGTRISCDREFISCDSIHVFMYDRVFISCDSIHVGFSGEWKTLISSEDLLDLFLKEPLLRL